MNHIQVSGRQKRFNCSSNSTLLAAMIGKGVELIPVGCRAGGCGVCKIRVLEGNYSTKKMSRAQITEEEEQAGYALACRVYPLSDMLVETIEKAIK